MPKNPVMPLVGGLVPDFTLQLLAFVRQAGAERSTGRLLGEMARFVGRTFAVERVSVFLTQEGRLRPFVSEYSTSAGSRELYEVWRQLEIEGFPLMQRMLAGEEVVVVEDPTTDDGLPPEIVRQFEVRPYLALALREGENLIGVVIIEGPPDLLVERIDEFTVLTEYVMLFLANARAYEREMARAREAEILLEAAQVLAGTADLTGVLARVAQDCAKLVGFDRCSIFLVDEDGVARPTMSQFADGHVDETAWAGFRRLPPTSPAIDMVVETGRPAVYEDPGAVPDLISPETVERFGLKTAVYVPLVAWGETLGVAVLDDRTPRRVTQQQVKLAQGVAAHGAVAIGLSRLLERERAAKERLLDLDRLKTAFVATVSHELRTPLTTIVGFGQILGEMLTEPEPREFAELITRESSHLEAMVGNLLDVSRLEAGALHLQPATVDVGEIVGEACNLAEYLFPDRRFLLQTDPDLTLEADGKRLRRVFVNLLENAAKYSPAGTPVEITARRVADRIEVTITDRGAGIPEDQRKAVFERFYRIDPTAVAGTGIGLYLVKELVEAHGGEVTVADGPHGVGTSITVRFAR